MGLMIYSLESVPTYVERDYYIYLLDYGWDEPIIEILNKNFDKMAQLAENSSSVIVKGCVGSHFQNEVLSWHHINGEDADKLLPALLITNAHPQYFREAVYNYELKKNSINAQQIGELKMILIPFKNICKNGTDVINIVKSVFDDISKKTDIVKFRIVKEQKRGMGKAFIDSLILEPNFSGIGFDLKKFFRPQ